MTVRHVSDLSPFKEAFPLHVSGGILRSSPRFNGPLQPNQRAQLVKTINLQKAQTEQVLGN